MAIIGAGPYGLAAAARLARAGVPARIFGHPMSFWRSMPKGMLLRSRWEACSIGDVAGPLTLDAFQARTDAPIGRPVPLDAFVRYADWFRERAVPEVDSRLVERVETADGGYALTLADGEELHARRVLVAAGLGPFAHRPAAFAHLPPELCSHTSEHADLGAFAGRRVLVVGGGQSALESAALLREAGAEAEVVLRAGRIVWLTGARTRRRLGPLVPLFYAQTDVGPAGMSRVLAVPGVFRRFPRRLQDPMASRAIRPAGAAWLPPRLADAPITVGASVTSAQENGGGVAVTADDGRRRTVDHVLLGTGYRVDVRRYPFLSPELATSLECVNGYPVLSPALESSAPGLHFLGAPAAWSIGPLMRFVSGTWYASRAVTRAIAR